MCTHLDAHLAGDLAHRLQQRQRSVGFFDGLVGDAGDLLLDQRLGQRRKRCQVEVGVEQQPRAQVGVLGLERRLHLHHQVGARPRVGGLLDDLRPGAGIIGVEFDRTLEKFARLFDAT